MDLWKPRWCNCLIWAFRQYALLRRQFGERRVVIQCRKSAYVRGPVQWIVPHFYVGLVGNDHRVSVWSFVPDHPRVTWCPPLFYRGHVQTG